MDSRAEPIGDSEESGNPSTNQLAGIVRVAMDRIGSRNGFDFIAAFLPWRKLLEIDSGYDGSIFLGPMEHSVRFKEWYSTPESRTQLTLALLMTGLRSVDSTAADLAARIAERMMDTAARGRMNRPHLYMGTTTDGVAAVIAIYDKFWTDSW
ncbi:hypothetical protein [Nocardia wallacei]|uniref:hypothetical protein n=1 Tax=Nocardia wallacei TaxID=480035 RepID=UPI002455CC64|nr:hypothetical protein [Nocardia wallacei]